jgi:hypothetical protein
MGQFVAMTIHENQRTEERVSVALPVSIDQASGVTLNVSASGICFETDVNCIEGSEISFVIELDGLAEKVLLKCKGQIVRTEIRGQKNGVAVKVLESVLETLS